MIDFERWLTGSSDSICDVLKEDLSAYARSVFVTKATIESLEGRIRVVGCGDTHEAVVCLCGVIGEKRGL